MLIRKRTIIALWNSQSVFREVVIYFRLFSEPDKSTATDLWFSVYISFCSLLTLILRKLNFIFVEKETSHKFDDKSYKLLLSMVFQKRGRKKCIYHFSFVKRTSSIAFFKILHRDNVTILNMRATERTCTNSS